MRCTAVSGGALSASYSTRKLEELENMELPILVVPGWTHAGPEHWQTLWQRENPDWIQVEQTDWETPQTQDWLPKLEQYVQACEPPPLC